MLGRDELLEQEANRLLHWRGLAALGREDDPVLGFESEYPLLHSRPPGPPSGEQALDLVRTQPTERAPLAASIRTVRTAYQRLPAQRHGSRQRNAVLPALVQYLLDLVTVAANGRAIAPIGDRSVVQDLEVRVVLGADLADQDLDLVGLHLACEDRAEQRRVLVGEIGAVGADAQRIPDAPVALRLAFRPPFDWAGFCKMYRREAVPGVEEVANSRIRVAVRFSGSDCLLKASIEKDETCVELRMSGVPTAALSVAVAIARQVMDLDANPAEIHKHLSARCRPESVRRIPGVWSPFAYLVRAVAESHDGRETADRATLELTNRLGSSPRLDAELRSFPDPTSVAHHDLRSTGLSRAASGALMRLADALTKGALAIEHASVPAGELATQLVPFLGSAPNFDPRHLAMRIVGDPDAYAEPLLLREKVLPASDRGWSPWSSYLSLADASERGRAA